MSNEILGRLLTDFSPLYRSKADSTEGRQLASLIADHAGLMEMATEHRRPAIATLLSLLKPDLYDLLHTDDHLLRTFGHLVGVQMQKLGFIWDVDDEGQRQSVNWPYSHKVSVCQIYRCRR